MSNPNIEFNRRNGNGFTRCVYCENKGLNGLTWDSMTYNVRGFDKPMCSVCLSELKKQIAFGESNISER